MGIRLKDITAFTSDLLAAGNTLLTNTSGSLTRLVRWDTLADWILKTYAGFTQSGSGAISRTMQDKGREIEKTPQDYGGTTGADIVEAIVEVDAQSQNGFVRVPASDYTLTSSLDVPTFVDLVGDGRWNTRFNFALSSSGACVDLAGASTNDRVRSSVRRARIDGTNCTDANVIGVSLNWNQSQQPILDEVTIYGGYESGGSSTGLKNGLVFVEDGSNWNVSFRELAIEGCHGDGLVIDTASGGSSNAVNFYGGRIENNKGRNVAVVGPNDDINSGLVNFFGTVIEGASYQSTGVTANVHIEGAVTANLSNVWIEALASPNWATYEVYVPSGRLNMHSCQIAWAQTGLYVGGEVTLSGKNVIRSSTAGIHIAATGTLNIEGEAVTFLGAGTPITFSAGATINWTRKKIVQKTSNYTITTADLGCTFTDLGTKQAVTFTLPNSPEGGELTFVNGGITLRNSTYAWNASGSGTDEWYVTLAGGGNPGLTEPTKFYSFATSRTKGTVGALSSLEWGWGDNDSLGFSTIYFRTPADPDTQSAQTMIATYPITIAPSNSLKITPTGTSPTDSIVSDAALGTSITLRCLDNAFWLETQKTGTWT